MASNVATVSQIQQGKQKRPPKTNWSGSEITVLTEKVEETLDLSRSKFSNNVTNAKKNAAWLEIIEAVNAVGVAYRTLQEVQDKRKNLTSTARKEFSDFGKEQRKTSGGLVQKKSHQMRRLRSSRYLKKQHRSLAFQALRQIQVSLSLNFLQFVLCSLRAKSHRQASEFKFLVLN